MPAARAVASGCGGLPEIGAKALAAFGLVCISTTVGIVQKASQAATGGFHFSTTSAIAIAEFVKLLMSIGFHIGDPSHTHSHLGRVQSAILSAQSQLSWHAIAHIMVLAVGYAVNNQISFYVYTLVDPGTIFLFKAGSTMIVAAIQCLCTGKRFSGEQWMAMLLQCVGMVVVQYNPCQSSARYQSKAYAFMAFSTLLTAGTVVRNEYLVKNYKIGLNVQNMTLYFGGVVLNVSAFFFLPNPNNSVSAVGFFDGYDSPLALGVVFCNAMIGLAITAVYKYADAVTKCIASNITSVLLSIVSAMFFELQASITMWCGVFVVCFGVYAYTTGAQAVDVAPAKATDDSQAGDDEERSGKHKSDEELRPIIGKTDIGQ